MGCKSNTTSTSSASALVESKGDLFSEPSSVVVPSLDKLGVSYRVESLVPLHSSYSEHETRQIKVFIESLTLKQFHKIRNLMRGEKELRYFKNHTYNLIDFLPRAMQAVNGLRFEGWRRVYDKAIGPSSIKVMEDRNYVKGKYENELFIVTNCLATAYEISLARKRYFTLFLIQNSKFHDAFKGLSSGLDVINREEAASGSILAVVNKTTGWVDHAAIKVVDDLYFEKGGVSCDSFYRLVDFETIEHTYDPQKYNYVYLKPNPRRMKDLASFTKNHRYLDVSKKIARADLVELDNHKSVSGIMAKFYYVVDRETGVFRLEDLAFDKEYFKNLMEAY